MANTDRSRKLLVRSALVTSATIATFVGAQNLAMLDARQFVPTQVDTFNSTAFNTPTVIVQPTNTNQVIQHVAPSVIILRESTGQISNQNNPTNNNQVNIQPPVASQIAAPDPIVQVAPVTDAPQTSTMQRPIHQTSHSSR